MNPVRQSLAGLDDYVSGHMSDDDAAGFEEALFEAAGSPEVASADRLIRLLVRAGTSGAFDPWTSRREVEAWRAAGRRVALLEVGDRGVATEESLEGVELVVSRIPLEVAGIASVDAEISLPGVGVVKTIRDVKVDATDNAVYACCDVALYELVRQAPSVTSLVAVVDGKRQVVRVIESNLAER